MSQKMKLAIPSEFNKTNNFMGVYYIVHGLVLWLGSSYTAYLVYGNAQIPVLLQIPLMIALVVLSGFGLFFMALLGHEGFHGNMNSNRDISMVLGIVASAVAPLFVSVGYNVMHWQHHLYTNTPKDPDYLLYKANKTFFARLMNGPRDTTLTCFKNAFNLISCKDGLDKTYPFSKEKAKYYAIFNLALVAAVSILYVAFALLNPWLFLFIVILPVAAAQTYWSMAPYIEHAETKVGEGANSRTCTSAVLKFVLLGYNFHLCHHLYPRVQLHKLPALHRHLEKNGYLAANAVIEPSLLRVLAIGATKSLDF